MSYKITTALSESVLSQIKAGLDGGTLYLFAGSVPADADAALDMSATHTQAAAVTVSGTGLMFEEPEGATLLKSVVQDWEGTASFEGADSEASQLRLTFFRFCPAGDDGRGAGAGARLQGTVGVSGSMADMERSSDMITPGAPVSIATFAVRVGSIG